MDSNTISSLDTKDIQQYQGDRANLRLIVRKRFSSIVESVREVFSLINFLDEGNSQDW